MYKTIRNKLLLVFSLLMITNQHIFATGLAGVDEIKMNEALGGYQKVIGGIVGGLSLLGVLTAILALIFLLVRLSMYSTNPMARQMIIRNIFGTLIAVAILGCWNIILYLVLTSTVFS